jgi:hypothetical protein
MDTVQMTEGSPATARTRDEIVDELAVHGPVLLATARVITSRSTSSEAACTPRATPARSPRRLGEASGRHALCRRRGRHRACSAVRRRDAAGLRRHGVRPDRGGRPGGSLHGRPDRRPHGLRPLPAGAGRTRRAEPSAGGLGPPHRKRCRGEPDGPLAPRLLARRQPAAGNQQGTSRSVPGVRGSGGV